MDIFIEQGADWFLPVAWQDTDGNPLPLTGYTAAMQVRSTPESPDTVFDLTSATGGGIVINEADGTLAVYIPAAQSLAATPPAHDVGVYDLVITAPNGQRTRLLAGRVTFSPAVTR